MALSIDQKRLKATKFPPEFDKKVDIEKVNIDLMKRWIANKITTILGDEDDIVVETCYNLVEQSQFPKIKEIQIQLTGFLGKDTAPFCKELWDLMLSAQDSPMGVPRELLEAKKAELQQEQLSKAAADARRAEDQAQNAMIDSFRQSERSDRPERGRGGGGRYRGSDRRGRGRDFDRGHPRRDSRSPPYVSYPYIRKLIYSHGIGEEGIPHQIASATCIYLEEAEVAVVEGVTIGLASAVVPLQAVVLHPHHLVVHVAHHRQDHREVHPGAEHVTRHRLIAPGLRLAVRDGDLLQEATLRPRDGEERARTGLGLLSKIREGYLGTIRDLVLLVINRAHQRPGSERDHHHIALHAVDAALLRDLPDL
ncbi:PWI domain-containing protein [Bipolaris maydis]|uniref:PWI domain-containing protein n=1 Tax=Cochliobolus heterostrophus TaxID=5016 RepID=UPI0024D8363D|nr:PWI domain-containing protein [Bipolaris maydis]KAJ6271359.1 PWI domain-containing protein [Bipolaris maydis]KAJ6282583.1 PWI domain-containing protein [Bipolaris maydis]